MGESCTEIAVSMGDEENFVFAFNDFDFSDRILHVHITPEEEVVKDDGEVPKGDKNGDREDSTESVNKFRGEKYSDWFSCIQSTDSDSCDGAKVKTLHISSPILAAKSRFFYKLFKNGMRESQHKNDVSFKIRASEEATLMELLRFMYGDALSATSFAGLVDLLIAADKFEVKSCMRRCVEMLLKLPMSLESALFYLELPSSVLVSEIVKPLFDAAEKYVVALYKDFTRSQEEAMELPLSAIEVVLGSEGLQVISEDEVYDFVLKWARASYSDLEERREVMTERLAKLICFQNMSVPKLKEVLSCADFDHEQVSKLVVEALFSKFELSWGQNLHNSIHLSNNNFGSAAGRVSRPHCVVFFDITKDDCAGCAANLYSRKQISSPTFWLGENQLYFSVPWIEEANGLGLYVKPSGSKACTLDCETAVLKKSSRQFESRLKAKNHTLGPNGWGSVNLLGITRAKLMSNGCDYFINRVLRVRAEFTLR